ncbi:MAG: hypothetical protein CMQ45_10910 [Gammaproteobacteria bacterium]|nr:hypothetical protein [Gammaproteobacteria bacterium]
MNPPDSTEFSPRFGIGVDFGTSNSAAAVYDGKRIHLIPLEENAVVMPSATYIDKELRITTGQAAIDRYVESNMGRTVELSAEVLGEGRSTTGQIGDKGLPEEAQTELIYGQSLVDGGLQGRLFRGIKRLLGNRNAPRLMVFDRPFRLVALVTPLLVRIQQSVEKLTRKFDSDPKAADHACIGHPVNFEGNEQGRNQLALTLLKEAYGYAGFSRRSLYPEPVAAALSYLHQYPAVSQQTILAVDFGGGTLDLCLLKRFEEGFKVIGTHGIGLGGDHIDQLMFKEILFPLLGKGERWRRAGSDREIETFFPFEDYEELLLNWAVSYMLNQNRFTTPLMRRIEEKDEASIKFRRLYDLIKNNYSYLVFQSLRDLKAELSGHETARLDIPEIDIDLIVSRDHFEEIIRPVLSELQAAIEAVLERSEVKPEQIQLVIRTGGTSLIPAVKRLLDKEFPGKVIEHDPFTSVAAGLAIAEYRGLSAQSYNGPESVSRF